MAIIDVTDIPDFLHTEATWEEYEDLLEAVGDDRIFITYDRGQLEIMTPRERHEGGKSVVACLLEALMNERRIVYQCGGSTTIRRKRLRRGLEPDECYWIANARAFTLNSGYDADRDPPPDLAIEVDVSRSSINRMGIYAALGVPEVWRYARNHTLTMHYLDENGEYQSLDRSSTFPELTVVVMERFLHMSIESTTAEVVWAFQDWLRGA